MDVDAIEPGVDFVKSLDEQLAACIAFIAVIGPRWLTARGNDGNPRLDNPKDYVRLEIEAALKRDIRVIPVLVDGASMPQPSDLPPSLQALARRNAVEIAHHRFVADCDDLARGIKRVNVRERPWASKRQPIDYKRCCTDRLNAHPISGHRPMRRACPLGANSGHRRRSPTGVTEYRACGSFTAA